MSQVLTRDLEAVMTQMPTQSHEASLPPNHDIRHIVAQILTLATEAVDRQRTPLMMSQKIVQLLYKTPSQLARDVYVALLGRLCRQFEDVEREALTWLLYAEDEVSQLRLCSAPTNCFQRKYNVEVTVTLLRSGLINVTLQDQQLAKSLLADPRPNLLNFTARLIRECLSHDPPVTSQNQFAYSLEILGQLSQAARANEESVNLSYSDISVGLITPQESTRYSMIYMESDDNRVPWRRILQGSVGRLL